MHWNINLMMKKKHMEIIVLMTIFIVQTVQLLATGTKIHFKPSNKTCQA